MHSRLSQPGRSRPSRGPLRVEYKVRSTTGDRLARPHLLRSTASECRASPAEQGRQERGECDSNPRWGVNPTAVFKTATFVRSVIPPWRRPSCHSTKHKALATTCDAGPARPSGAAAVPPLPAGQGRQERRERDLNPRGGG